MESFMTEHVYSLVHWPFLAFAFVAMVINQFLKVSLFTKKRAHVKSKVQWFWWWGWKCLPLYPILIGGLVGVFWINPEGADPCWSRIASFFYFAVSGAISISLYQVIKGIAKKRGYDIGDLPGNETES